MANRQRNSTREKPEVIRFLVQKNNGDDVIIEVPAHWKVTFGYVNPAKSSDAYRSNEGHCLRLYEGEKLRAAIGNVKGFRDLSIPLARKFSKESGQTAWSRDSDGAFKNSESREIESGFVVEESDDPFDEEGQDG